MLPSEALKLSSRIVRQIQLLSIPALQVAGGFAAISAKLPPGAMENCMMRCRTWFNA
jgi:hypothetical protein